MATLTKLIFVASQSQTFFELQQAKQQWEADRTECSSTYCVQADRTECSTTYCVQADRTECRHHLLCPDRHAGTTYWLHPGRDNTTHWQRPGRDNTTYWQCPARHPHQSLDPADRWWPPGSGGRNRGRTSRTLHHHGTPPGSSSWWPHPPTASSRRWHRTEICISAIPMNIHAAGAAAELLMTDVTRTVIRCC